MGLELFVMPIWRFLAGQYQGPAEAFGAVRIGSSKPDDAETSARARVDSMRRDLEERLTGALNWKDEGEVALTLQYSYVGLQSIRAFAAFQDHPLPRNPDGSGPAAFTLDVSSPEEHPSLLTLYHLEAPTRFPHLIDHSDSSGFYLPCDFDLPLRCYEFLDGEEADPEAIEDIIAAARQQEGDEVADFIRTFVETTGADQERDERLARLRRETNYPPRRNEHTPRPPAGMHVQDWYKVGSSIRLLRELDDLNLALGMTRDWGELRSGEAMAAEDDPLGSVKYGWGVLHYVARVSVATGLPIVFDG